MSAKYFHRTRADFRIAVKTEVCLLDATSQKELGRVTIEAVQNRNPQAGAGGLAFSSDGKHLALADHGIVLIDGETGKELRRFDASIDSSTHAVFSPDGRTLAVAGLRQRTYALELYETATGQLRMELPGHGGPIYSMAYSPGGTTLATGGGDATILLWDVGAVRRPIVESEWPGLLDLLTADDGRKAFVAMRRLAGSPAETVRRLKIQLPLKEAPIADAATIAKWVSQLNDAQFRIRDQAQNDLEKLGEPARAELEKALRGDTPLESRRRIELLLGKLVPGLLLPADRLAVRAIEVLECIGTSEARDLVAALSVGAPATRLVREAQATLRRMKKGS